MCHCRLLFQEFFVLFSMFILTAPTLPSVKFLIYTLCLLQKYLFLYNESTKANIIYTEMNSIVTEMSVIIERIGKEKKRSNEINT